MALTMGTSSGDSYRQPWHLCCGRPTNMCTTASVMLCSSCQRHNEVCAPAALTYKLHAACTLTCHHATLVLWVSGEWRLLACLLAVFAERLTRSTAVEEQHHAQGMTPLQRSASLTDNVSKACNEGTMLCWLSSTMHYVALMISCNIRWTCLPNSESTLGSMHVAVLARDSHV